MKKFIAIISAVVICISSAAFPVAAYEFDDSSILAIDAFDQQDESLEQWFMWLPMDVYGKRTYHDMLEDNFASTLHELLIPFDTGRIEGNERTALLNQYGFSELYNIYRLDEMQQTFNAAYNTNIDIASLDGLKMDGSHELIKIADGYVFVQLSPHGTMTDPNPSGGNRLGSDSEYWRWYYADDWNPSDTIYTIVSYKNVAGYDIQTIDYIGYEPPTDALLTTYERNKENIIITINGEHITFDQPPIIYNDRTLVPLRAIFEALGAEVTWDGDTQTVTAKKGGTTIKLTIGEYEFYKNGSAIPLDVPGMILNDRTLVPVRAVSEAFNCTVDWDGDTRTVYIYYDETNDSGTSAASGVADILMQYARDNLSVLYEDDYTGQHTYTDVRYLLADVSGDDEPELLAAGIDENGLRYLEIYKYENGAVIDIMKEYFGYAHGGAMNLAWYDGGVRVSYTSSSSGTGFLDRLMKYENGEWVDVYSSYVDIDNAGTIKGYVVNGEYVSEEEIDKARENVSKNPVTLSDFGDL